MEARASRMPILMLTPLVENAVHHGRGPKRDGGTVVVSGEVRAGRLVVRIIRVDALRRRARTPALAGAVRSRRA